MNLPDEQAVAHSELDFSTAETSLAKTLLDYVSVAKRKRPNGILNLDEIGHVVTELLTHHERIDRQELIRKVARTLDFPEEGFKRIGDAIRRLEDLKKVCGDSKCVWRIGAVANED